MFLSYWDNFETIRKREIIWKKFGQFWNRPENWQSSGKIRTVLKPSGKLAMIRKNPDRFGSIGRVEQVFSVVRAKTFQTRKNFPGSNVTLLPRFLGLCCTDTLFEWCLDIWLNCWKHLNHTNKYEVLPKWNVPGSKITTCLLDWTVFFTDIPLLSKMVGDIMTVLCLK